MKSFLVSATIAAILGLLASRFFTPPPDKVEKVVEKLEALGILLSMMQILQK